MHHARWLTTGSRILRYFMSDPTVRREEVETLARYIVQVYYKVKLEINVIAVISELVL